MTIGTVAAVAAVIYAYKLITDSNINNKQLQQKYIQHMVQE